MMYRPQRIVPPAELAVSPIEAGVHLNLDVSLPDDLARVTAYLRAAVSRLDGYDGVLGRCLVTQTWRVQADEWRSEYCLPFPDVQSASVFYIDPDGVQQQVPTETHWIAETHTGALLQFESPLGIATRSSGGAPVYIDVQAGYGAPLDVPFDIRTAIMMLVGEFYENREGLGDNSSIPHGVDVLLAPYRWVSP